MRKYYLEYTIKFEAEFKNNLKKQTLEMAQ